MTNEEAKGFIWKQHCTNCNDKKACRFCEYNFAIKALEKQIPMKPNFVVEKYEHHEWFKDEDGRIDKWAMSFDFHNGPMCSRCYKTFCVHCEGNYEEIINEECDCSHYECPNCHTQLNNNEHRCKCGQAIDWSDDK